MSDDIENCLHVVAPRKILCIGLKNGLLRQLERSLAGRDIPIRWATKIPSSSSNYVVLADYVEAKGLERDYVFIVDADHLAHKQGTFETQEQYRERSSKDRIKLFIALTRAMREVSLYYVDRQHIFIDKLCELQANLIR
jgi:superfamily I DNA/RNA helicase